MHAQDTLVAIYNRNTILRLELRELQEKRKEADRDRDTWKTRLDEAHGLQQHGNAPPSIGNHQPAASEKVPKRIPESVRAPISAPAPAPAPSLPEKEVQEAFKSIRQQIEDLVNSPYLRTDGVHRPVNASTSSKDWKVLDVMDEDFWPEWTVENRKLRVRGLIFDGIYEHIFAFDPWLDALDARFDTENNTEYGTSQPVTDCIRGLLKPIQRNIRLSTEEALDALVLDLITNAYEFRIVTRKYRPEYVVCDPFPKWRGAGPRNYNPGAMLVDCVEFVEPVGFSGPACVARNADLHYTVFGGLVKSANEYINFAELVWVEKVQAVLVQTRLDDESDDESELSSVVSEEIL